MLRNYYGNVACFISPSKISAETKAVTSHGHILISKVIIWKRDTELHTFNVFVSNILITHRRFSHYSCIKRKPTNLNLLQQKETTPAHHLTCRLGQQKVHNPSKYHYSRAKSPSKWSHTEEQILWAAPLSCCALCNNSKKHNIRLSLSAILPECRSYVTARSFLFLVCV